MPSHRERQSSGALAEAGGAHSQPTSRDGGAAVHGRDGPKDGAASPSNPYTIRRLLLEDYNIALPEEDRDLAVRCPWHHDSATSLIVNPIRGTWKCVGCTRHGGVADYLVFFRGMSIAAARRAAGDTKKKLKEWRRRPGHAAIHLMKQRAREELIEHVGHLLSAPVVANTSISVSDCLLPSAEPHLKRAAAEVGFRLDWAEGTLSIAHRNPRIQEVLKSIGKNPRMNLSGLLLRLKGAKIRRQPMRFAGTRYCPVVIPLSSIGIGSAETNTSTDHRRSST